MWVASAIASNPLEVFLCELGDTLLEFSALRVEVAPFVWFPALRIVV
jgi:hypothetical protein